MCSGVSSATATPGTWRCFFCVRRQEVSREHRFGPLNNRVEIALLTWGQTRAEMVLRKNEEDVCCEAELQHRLAQRAVST